VDTQMEYDRHPDEPAAPEQDPNQGSIYPTLCNRYGVRNRNWQH